MFFPESEGIKLTPIIIRAFLKSNGKKRIVIKIHNKILFCFYDKIEMRYYYREWELNSIKNIKTFNTLEDLLKHLSTECVHTWELEQACLMMLLTCNIYFGDICS